MFNIIFIGKLYFKWEKKKHGFKCILHVKVNVMRGSILKCFSFAGDFQGLGISSRHTNWSIFEEGYLSAL